MRNRWQIQKKNFLKILVKCIPAIFMLCFIFTMSAKNAEESSQESSTITLAIVEMASFIKVMPVEVDEATLDMIDNVVREAAHFTEYFVLGLSLCLGMSGFFEKKEASISELGIWRRYREYRWLLLFGICYAISDEIHQYYVPGRCFQVMDIIVDSLGVSAGILLWSTIYSRRIRIR